MEEEFKNVTPTPKHEKSLQAFVKKIILEKPHGLKL